MAEQRDEQSERLALAFAQHAGSLRDFLAGVLKDWNAADEAVQATFVKALEATELTMGEDFRGWLFRVGFHEALAHRRREKTRETAHAQLGWLRDRLIMDAQSTQERTEELTRLRLLVDLLPEEERDLIRQRLEFGRTFAVIAQSSGLPLGTVLSRMRRALARLRSEWNKETR